jgi:hypothetical protein
MDDVTELRISKRERPELYETVEEALFNGETTFELGGETFEIVSSEVSLDDDAAFVLVKL